MFYLKNKFFINVDKINSYYYINNLILVILYITFFIFIEYLVFINTKFLEEIILNKRLLSQYYNKDTISNIFYLNKSKKVIKLLYAFFDIFFIF